MFKDYFKGSKGLKNKKLRSIFDILKELDSLGPKGSILKVLEIEREKAMEAAVITGQSSYSFSDLHNKSQFLDHMNSFQSIFHVLSVFCRGHKGHCVYCIMV